MPSVALRHVSVDEARAFIFSQVQPIPRFETVSLTEAVGRIAAESVESPTAIPAYTNSAMDGFAFCAADLQGETVALKLTGESLAGHPYSGRVAAGEAVRITTGAAVPADCDTVIPFEKTTETAGTVTFSADAVLPGDNIRHRGETVSVGDIVISRGTRLTAAHAALLANLGLARVTVTAPVRAAVIATGDELVEPGQPCSENHLYNANSTMLTALLTALKADVVDFGIVPDKPDAVRDAFLRAADECDILFTSGGAAAGEADFTHKILEDEGEIAPWQINMRPGKPMRFGRLRGKPVFLLPGNPVACAVTFMEFARATVLALSDAADEVTLPRTFPVILACDVKKKEGRAEFMRATLERTTEGLSARPLKDQGSAALTTLTEADVILTLPAEGHEFPAGTVVKAQLLSELLA